MMASALALDAGACYARRLKINREEKLISDSSMHSSPFSFWEKTILAPRLKYKNIEFLKKLGNSDKPSLTKINKVLEVLNNPHKKNMGIKIAISGTNGKGSVAKSLSEILNKVLSFV